MLQDFFFGTRWIRKIQQVVKVRETMSEHSPCQRLPPLQKQLEGRTPSALTEREQPEKTGQGRLAGHKTR